MIKLFVTGDNHIGKKYDRYPEIKDQLIESRFRCLQDMVEKAKEEACSIFIVTGDLFDSINTVKVGDVKRVVEILAGFDGVVLILPGNHDYYTGDEKVWKDFESALSVQEHNIILMNEWREYTFDVGEDKVVIYPAYCQSKHSKENNLRWIKERDIKQDGVLNIGIAHGAIEGITPDMKEEYFLMKESELAAIPVDVWLLGHTHIPYPNVLKSDSDTSGYKIFNAGTHEQTDLHNNTEGNAFIIMLDKQGNNAKVMARKVITGKVRFYDIEVVVKPDSDTALFDMLHKALEGKNKMAVVRVTVSGTVKQSEYQNKEKIYRAILGEYLTFEKRDHELSEEITIEKIRDEYAETSFASRFLEQLIAQPVELQMAYRLLQECKEKEHFK